MSSVAEGLGQYDEDKMAEEYFIDKNNEQTLAELKNTLKQVTELGYLDEELQDLFQKAIEYYNSVSLNKMVLSSDAPFAAFYKAAKAKMTQLNSNKTL